MTQPIKHLEFDVKQEKNQTTIFLKGPIDETSQLSRINATTPNLVFNLREVSSLSSRGIVAWQEFLDQLRSTKVQMEECPTLVVRQMNLVPSFRRHATVKSVYLAYTCDECDAEKLVLVDAAKFPKGKPTGIPATLPCETCKKGTMEPDTPLDRYFFFAKS